MSPPVSIPSVSASLKPMLMWLAIVIFPVLSFGQDTQQRPRRAVGSTDSQGASKLENDTYPVIDESTLKLKTIAEGSDPAMLRFRKMLQGAIVERLGAPYSFGATGPYAFDCSGFVWSTFKEAGVTFQRSSARSLWEEFEPPKEEDKLRFGTLVFFSGISHIGIVADDKGFYHASHSHGVMYSPFNAYWKERIDGFRRIPLSDLKLSE